MLSCPRSRRHCATESGRPPKAARRDHDRCRSGRGPPSYGVGCPRPGRRANRYDAQLPSLAPTLRNGVRPAAEGGKARPRSVPERTRAAELRGRLPKARPPRKQVRCSAALARADIAQRSPAGRRRRQGETTIGAGADAGRRATGSVAQGPAAAQTSTMLSCPRSRRHCATESGRPPKAARRDHDRCRSGRGPPSYGVGCPRPGRRANKYDAQLPSLAPTLRNEVRPAAEGGKARPRSVPERTRAAELRGRLPKARPPRKQVRCSAALARADIAQRSPAGRRRRQGETTIGAGADAGRRATGSVAQGPAAAQTGTMTLRDSLSSTFPSKILTSAGA